MADVDMRVLERCAARGDEVAQLKLEHQRCRIGEHCGCRVDVSELVNDHWLAISGLNDYRLSTGELEIVDASVLQGRVTFEIEATNREALLHRLRALCHKLSIDEPPALDVMDRHCPYCKAQPGRRCMTSGGKLAHEWHADRKSPPGMRIIDDRYSHDDYYEDWG